MSVRGSKGKIILYIVGACSLLFVILLYQNASQKLEELEKSYQRCHLNEESLSAQLQVNLEYKVRLEKSLQQQKSDHSQVKEELKNKLEEERQGREREKLESINKFTALQQQYKFLQSQHEDVNLECGKLRQLHSTEIEEKNRLETLVQHLRDELKLVKENKNNEIEQLKAKRDLLEKENIFLKENNRKGAEELRGRQTSRSQIKLPDTLPLNASSQRAEERDQPDQLQPGNGIVSSKLPTSGKKAEQELFPSGNNVYVKTSTPMINPDAVNSQDKFLSPGPATQPSQSKQESAQNNFHPFENKENVGAKPEEMARETGNDQVPGQRVLQAPDILKDFQHVPVIQNYKEKLQQEANFYHNNNNKNNVGEIMYEKRPLPKPDTQPVKPWREGEIPNLFFVRQPAGNEIQKNPVYQADYNDGRKEEGEDDDDVDPLEYLNKDLSLEKNQQQQQQQLLLQQQHHLPQQQEEPPNHAIHVQMPFQDKRESVMIQPK